MATHVRRLVAVRLIAIYVHASVEPPLSLAGAQKSTADGDVAGLKRRVQDAIVRESRGSRGAGW